MKDFSCSFRSPALGCVLSSAARCGSSTSGGYPRPPGQPQCCPVPAPYLHLAGPPQLAQRVVAKREQRAILCKHQCVVKATDNLRAGVAHAARQSVCISDCPSEWQKGKRGGASCDPAQSTQYS